MIYNISIYLYLHCAVYNVHCTMYTFYTVYIYVCMVCVEIRSEL